MRKPTSEATKRKISQSLLGRKRPEWHRAKMRKPKTITDKLKASWEKMRGVKRPLSEETKKKISLAHQNRSPEFRMKMSLARRGDKSHLWKGGVTKINLVIRASVEYKLWREAVFKRDNYQCIWGGKEHGKKLNADHIKPFALFPELRFAIDNGRTLCEDCHRKTDTFGVNTNHYE